MPRQLLGTPKLSPVLARVASKRDAQMCRVMIETRGIGSDRVLQFIEGNQGHVEQEVKLIPAMVAMLPAPVLTGLVHFPQVLKIWENSRVKILSEESNPVYGSALAQEYKYSGKGVTVAVLDTGIYPHEDLSYPENRILAWNDLLGGQTTPYDDHGHGTHVAGLIAGNGRTSHGRYKGVAPDARLVGVKVLDQTGEGYLADLLLGIEWCLANLKTLKIRVLNLSLGTRSQGIPGQEPLVRATSLAWKKGVVVCAAAGKPGTEYQFTNSPGVNEQIITVGNLNLDDPLTKGDEHLQPWSREAQVTPSRYTVPDLVARGHNLVAPKTEGGYCTYNGSSAATSLVAGSVALILEKWPFLKPEQIKRLLKSKAGDLGLGAPLQGAGLLNLEHIFGKELKTKSSGNNGEMVNSLVRAAINFLGKQVSGSPVKLNDLLMLVLPLLNQLVNGRDG